MRNEVFKPCRRNLILFMFFFGHFLLRKLLANFQMKKMIQSGWKFQLCNFPSDPQASGCSVTALKFP